MIDTSKRDALIAHAAACRTAMMAGETRPPLPEGLRDLAGVDLVGTNLRGLDLSGVGLSGTQVMRLVEDYESRIQGILLLARAAAAGISTSNINERTRS